MKTISLWQPWASLWLAQTKQGARFKLHETRHWHIKDQWKGWPLEGKRLGVHAAKRFEKDHDPDLADILRTAFGSEWYRTLPTGALIGSIDVVACVPAGQLEPLGDDDRVCGDFADGRWAWRGENPIVLRSPIPWRGSQGIFNVPDEIFAAEKAA